MQNLRKSLDKRLIRSWFSRKQSNANNSATRSSLFCFWHIVGQLNCDEHINEVSIYTEMPAIYLFLSKQKIKVFSKWNNINDFCYLYGILVVGQPKCPQSDYR